MSSFIDNFNDQDDDMIPFLEDPSMYEGDMSYYHDPNPQNSDPHTIVSPQFKIPQLGNQVSIKSNTLLGLSSLIRPIDDDGDDGDDGDGDDDNNDNKFNREEFNQKMVFSRKYNQEELYNLTHPPKKSNRDILDQLSEDSDLSESNDGDDDDDDDDNNDDDDDDDDDDVNPNSLALWSRSKFDKKALFDLFQNIDEGEQSMGENKPKNEQPSEFVKVEMVQLDDNVESNYNNNFPQSHQQSTIKNQYNGIKIETKREFDQNRLEPTTNIKLENIKSEQHNNTNNNNNNQIKNEPIHHTGDVYQPLDHNHTNDILVDVVNNQRHFNPDQLWAQINANSNLIKFNPAHLNSLLANTPQSLPQHSQPSIISTHESMNLITTLLSLDEKQYEAPFTVFPPVEQFNPQISQMFQKFQRFCQNINFGFSSNLLMTPPAPLRAVIPLINPNGTITEFPSEHPGWVLFQLASFNLPHELFELDLDQNKDQLIHPFVNFEKYSFNKTRLNLITQYNYHYKRSVHYLSLTQSLKHDPTSAVSQLHLQFFSPPPGIKTLPHQNQFNPNFPRFTNVPVFPNLIPSPLDIIDVKKYDNSIQFGKKWVKYYHKF